MRFGEKLRKIRQEHDLTQPGLAEQLGIEQSWLSKLENDKSIPSSDLLDRICQVFNLNLEQLLSDLDQHYVRSQLASLPEVRGLLQEKRFVLAHNARRWLLTATALVAIGLTAFMSGNSRWIFSDVSFYYESKGVVFAGEPELLFDDSRDSLAPIIIQEIEKASTSEGGLNQYYRSNISHLHDIFFERSRAKLLHRESFDIHVQDKHLGDFYRIKTQVQEDAIDIYGNTVIAGSPAHRIYVFSDAIPNPRWQNTVLQILGMLLAISGLLLYFVEWRMARITGFAGNNQQ